MRSQPLFSASARTIWWCTGIHCKAQRQESCQGTDLGRATIHVLLHWWFSWVAPSLNKCQFVHSKQSCRAAASLAGIGGLARDEGMLKLSYPRRPEAVIAAKEIHLSLWGIECRLMRETMIKNNWTQGWQKLLHSSRWILCCIMVPQYLPWQSKVSLNWMCVKWSVEEREDRCVCIDLNYN